MRITTNIILFMVVVNAVTVALGAAGVYEDWGVEVRTGIEDDVERLTERMDRVRGGAFGGQTLIGLFLMLKDFLTMFYSLAFALPTLISSLGIPIVGIFLTPLVPMLVAINILSAVSGRGI